MALPPPSRSALSNPLPELEALHRLIDMAGAHAQARAVAQVAVGDHRFDVISVTLGNPSADAPAIGVFGGVHGLERIGAEVVLACLASLVQRLRWDDAAHALLSQLRLVFMPLVNPGGLWRGTRANPQGVDLMRNAPVDATAPVPFLIGGQRWSAALPWYRGQAHEPMQAESVALCEVVRTELLSRPFSIAIDCHSGFGLLDRIWFPYAHTPEPIAHLAEIHALHRIFDQTHAHHRYVFEPQSVHYLAHGDLWDHLYQQAVHEHPEHVFLPLTLEMGSWIWVKKNPRQLFSRHGIFNPLIAHRQQRVLRQHMALLDFLARAAASHVRWRPAAPARDLHHRQALARWYERPPSATRPEAKAAKR
ncbi:MAG: M14 family zinc carboxypeptidase [Aquabacterium sp.]